MRKKDEYVHGMDWTKHAGNYELYNYRKYQYDLIGKYIGNNILEIGSGEKGFTKELVKNSKYIKRLISIEPSEILFRIHKNRYKFPGYVSFYKKDLFDLTPKIFGLFDTIVFIHVLEHIKKDKKALDTACRLLKPGGFVLIEVPALPFLFSPHDKLLGHYRRYTKNYLLSIIDKKKFVVEDIWYQDFFGMLGSLLFFKWKKIKLNSNDGVKLVHNQGKLYDKYIVPFQSFIEKFIRPPIGLSLTAVIRKK